MSLYMLLGAAKMWMQYFRTVEIRCQDVDAILQNSGNTQLASVLDHCSLAFIRVLTELACVRTSFLSFAYWYIHQSIYLPILHAALSQLLGRILSAVAALFSCRLPHAVQTRSAFPS